MVRTVFSAAAGVAASQNVLKAASTFVAARSE
jgi:hypothetical protein